MYSESDGAGLRVYILRRDILRYAKRLNGWFEFFFRARPSGQAIRSSFWVKEFRPRVSSGFTL